MSYTLSAYSTAYEQMIVVVVVVWAEDVVSMLNRLLGGMLKWVSTGRLLLHLHQKLFSLLLSALYFAGEDHGKLFSAVVFCGESLNSPFVYEDRSFHMLLARILHRRLATSQKEYGGNKPFCRRMSRH